MSSPSLRGRGWRFALLDCLNSIGFALLIVSPYFLEKVRGNGYYVFDALESFLIPHLEAVGVSALLASLVVLGSRYWGQKSRWLMFFVSSLFLISVVRGFLCTAGITPQSMASALSGWLAFLGHDRPYPVVIRQVGLFVLFGLSLLVLSSLVRDTTAILRACAAFGWTLGLITVFRIVSIMATDAEFSTIRQQLRRSDFSAAPVDKRVVWVIFDEFDYNRFFKNRNPSLALPNLDRLQRESVSTLNAVSPAWSTAVSVPALITGTYLLGTERAGPGKLLLKRQIGNDIEWGKASTIFSRMQDKGKNFSILGFYHPYCNIFPYADPCLSAPIFFNKVWWWEIVQGLKAVPGFALLMRRYIWNHDESYQIIRLQLEELERHLSNKSTDLSFIHLNIPHMPGGRVLGVIRTKEVEALPGYEQNALTVDWIVGKIVESLEEQSQSQDILLVLSSDHWLRTKLLSSQSPDQNKLDFGNDFTEVRTIPLLIRRMRETSAYSIQKPISTVHTARLIEDFLASRVTDHASILAWWSDKPYIEPMIPASYGPI